MDREGAEYVLNRDILFLKLFSCGNKDVRIIINPYDINAFHLFYLS